MSMTAERLAEIDNAYQEYCHERTRKEIITEVKELKAQLAEARKLIERSRQTHHYCEDSWYSCPKAEGGCADDQWPENECNCGADKWNAKIDKWLTDQEGQG